MSAVAGQLAHAVDDIPTWGLSACASGRAAPSRHPHTPAREGEFRRMAEEGATHAPRPAMAAASGRGLGARLRGRPLASATKERAPTQTSAQNACPGRPAPARKGQIPPFVGEKVWRVLFKNFLRCSVIIGSPSLRTGSGVARRTTGAILTTGGRVLRS